jgi:hypothetical protein
MKFCPGQECPHYSKATRYDRQCYYEPQCWRGFVDAIMFTLGLRFGRRRADTETCTSAETANEGKVQGDKR